MTSFLYVDTVPVQSPHLPKFFSFHHHITVPLFTAHSQFYGQRLSVLPSFLLLSFFCLPLSTFPSVVPSCTMWHAGSLQCFCNHLTDRGGYARASPNITLSWGHVRNLSQEYSFFSHTHIKALKMFSSLFIIVQSCLFLPFLSLYMLLLLCLYCQPCHLPMAPHPSRVRSSVLTLGFIQICSLQGWKVVMRAKKNSLALNPTTRLVFLTKPNENSIFSPCYSLPSSIFTTHFMPPFSSSGASKSLAMFTWT